MNNTNDGINAVGIFVGAAEQFTRDNGGVRIAYTTINGTKALVNSAKVATVFKGAGSLTFGASIFIDVSLSLANQQSWGKTILNSTVGAAAIAVGGWPGLVLGAGYTVIDKTVGWDRALTPAENHPYIFYGVSGVPIIR